MLYTTLWSLVEVRYRNLINNNLYSHALLRLWKKILCVWLCIRSRITVTLVTWYMRTSPEGILVLFSKKFFINFILFFKKQLILWTLELKQGKINENLFKKQSWCICNLWDSHPNTIFSVQEAEKYSFLCGVRARTHTHPHISPFRLV